MKDRNRSLNIKKPSYFYSILSVALVLFLVGFFALVLFHGQDLLRNLKEQVNIIVELKPESSPSDVKAFKIALLDYDEVIHNSIKTIPKEEAMKLLAEDFGAEFRSLDLPNPLYDVVTFNVKADYLNASFLNVLRGRLVESDKIHDVFYQEGIIDQVIKNLKSASWWVLASSFVFFLIASTLIHNTLKLTLYSNRFIIKNMELVGATWGFISKPYILRGLLNGILSALIAILSLLLLLHFTGIEFTGFTSLDNFKKFTVILTSILILGIVISTLSTYYTVNKYLRMHVDQMY